MRYQIPRDLTNPHWESLLDEQDQDIKKLLGDTPFEIISSADYLKLLRATPKEERQVHPLLKDQTNLFINGTVYVLGCI